MVTQMASSDTMTEDEANNRVEIATRIMERRMAWEREQLEKASQWRVGLLEGHIASLREELAASHRRCSALEVATLHEDEDGSGDEAELVAAGVAHLKGEYSKHRDLARRFNYPKSTGSFPQQDLRAMSVASLRKVIAEVKEWARGEGRGKKRKGTCNEELEHEGDSPTTTRDPADYM
jgi:hypothetical protein